MFLVNVFLGVFGNNLLPQQGNVHAIHSRPSLVRIRCSRWLWALVMAIVFFDEVDIFEDPC